MDSFSAIKATALGQPQFLVLYVFKWSSVMCQDVDLLDTPS